METLKGVADNLGMTLIGVDLYPEHSGGQSMSLPQIVVYLTDWSRILTKDEGFKELVKSVASEVERSKT